MITKLALERLSPLVFIAVRFFIGTVCLLPVLWRDLRREHAGGGFCVGLLLFSGFWLQTAGLNHTTPSRNAFLTALCIPLTPLIECALLWRPPKGTELASAAIATLGTFCLTREPGGDAAAAAGAPAFSTSVSVGDWLSFSCAIVFAFHVLAMNRFATRGPGAAPTVAFGQVATTGVLATLACGAFEAPAVRNVTPSLMLAMLFCGAVATAGGFLAFTRAQGRMSATRSMISAPSPPPLRAPAAPRCSARAHVLSPPPPAPRSLLH